MCVCLFGACVATTLEKRVACIEFSPYSVTPPPPPAYRQPGYQKLDPPQFPTIHNPHTHTTHFPNPTPIPRNHFNTLTVIQIVAFVLTAASSGFSLSLLCSALLLLAAAVVVVVLAISVAASETGEGW